MIVYGCSSRLNILCPLHMKKVLTSSKLTILWKLAILWRRSIHTHLLICYTITPPRQPARHFPGDISGISRAEHARSLWTRERYVTVSPLPNAYPITAMQQAVVARRTPAPATSVIRSHVCLPSNEVFVVKYTDRSIQPPTQSINQSTRSI